MVALAAMLCNLVPQPAAASIFDTYGFGARGAGMGNALTAAARDYHAVYYNPAQLMERDQVHVGLGVTLVEPFLGIERLKLDSGQATVVAGTNVGVHVGVSTPIGGWFQRRIAFGVGIFVPLLRLTRAQFDDYAKPQFYMYENLPDKLLVAAGFAAKVFDWWKVGVGFQLLADLNGRADVQLSLIDNRVTRRRLSIDLSADLAAVAGMTFTPIDGLNLAASYRQELDLTFRLPIKALIEEVGTLDFEIAGTSLYTPHQLNVGASWRLPWIPLTIAADITWAMWSMAPSPSPDVAIILDDSQLNPDPDNRVGAVLDTRSAPVSLGAKDIVIPRIGLEYELGAFELRAGYFFRPTPIPRQLHETNYVDSDSHVVTLGTSWSFKDPTEVHKSPLKIGVAFQLTVLRSRGYDKADPADPTGSYTVSGGVFSFALDLQHDF